jgi:hypothetical protein
MADLVVIIPSRGRPESVRELLEAFDSTCTGNTELVLAVDDNDPTLGTYSETVAELAGSSKTRVSLSVVDQPTNMVHALNATAMASVGEPTPYAVGFMGDDHRPRTGGWDSAYLEALWDLGTGIVYGDDLLQRGGLPTQCAMTADIIRELGFMAPPTLTHLAVDNWWLELGRQAGCIRYLPDVVVEHMHPVAGKADWDEGHRRVNSPEMYSRDLAEFARIQSEDLPGHVAKVRGLRNG